MVIFKKISLTIASVLFGFLPFAALASTMSLTPANISVHVGDTFSVVVAANSPDARSYTVKTSGSFTPKILRFSSFTFADLWMALRQPGYESTNNTLGTFVRTAGFPTGFTGNEPFGTALFKAEKIGTGTISISTNSFILNAKSKNTFTSANKVTVNILPLDAPLPVPTTPSEEPPSTPTIITTPQAEVPALFDVSAQIISLKQLSYTTLFYGMLLVLVGIVAGITLLWLRERAKRRRILSAKKKNV